MSATDDLLAMKNSLIEIVFYLAFGYFVSKNTEFLSSYSISFWASITFISSLAFLTALAVSSSTNLSTNWLYLYSSLASFS